ncbi:MAG: peptidase [Anaerophaga sp.]|nr:peptidase [Anaerophaga sp.]
MSDFTTHRKKYWITLFWSFVFVLISLQPASAVGAFPLPQKMIQPDGSVITIRIHGDEWYNWTTTVDGYRILKNKHGFFEYATQLKSGEISGSGIIASDPGQRTVAEENFLSSTPKGIGISKKDFLEKRREKYTHWLKSSLMTTHFPSEGEASLLIILANFQDTNPTYPTSDFEAFMNQKNYNSTGSFRDYYQEVSGGLLTINSSVTQWLSVPAGHDYYGPESKWKEFALHAVQAAADAGVDFSAFDNDGDGVVESVAIIHQGAGQEVTSDPDDIWSHSYSFSSWGVPESERTFNGVVVDQYTIQPEWRSAAADMNTIGVICHEFGHNLGLPDFYDVDEEENGQYYGTGDWDIMAGGTYNGSPSGSSPAHHNPFSKAELGWVAVSVIDQPASISLDPVYSSKQVLRINSPVENEYLLLENRQKTGFDAFIPGNGLLVYHTDGNLIKERRSSNTINIDSHQGFYPLAANDIINDPSCPFPGTESVTELTDASSPAMQTWDGQGFNRSMTDITIVDTTITFDYMFLQDGTPLDFDAVTIDELSVKLSWTPSSNNYPVLVAWSPDGIFGNPVDKHIYAPGEFIDGGGTVLYYGDTDTTKIHSGLSPSTKYYYSVWSDKGDMYSQNLKDEALTRPSPITEFPWADGFEDQLNVWVEEYVSGEKSWSTQKLYVNETLVQPWSGSEYATFFAQTYSVPVTRLVSPKLELNSSKTYHLRFRHIQPEWEGDQDELKVLVRTESAGNWEEITRYETHTPEWTERLIEIPYSEPLEIAFEATGNYGYGIGIDSVEVYVTSACEVKPDISASGFSATNITKTSMDLSWGRGNGDALLILARKDQAITEIPENGVSYTADSNFGSGDALPNNTYVVYNGTGTSMTLSGLEHTSEYHLAFFEYYNTNICYETEGAAASFSTEPNIYDITVAVTDTDGNPLENAMVRFKEDTLYTDAAGEATFQTVHSDDRYDHFDVSKDTYSAGSDRFIPNTSKTINVSLWNFDPLPPHNLTGNKDYKTIKLEWSPVINENFDHYVTYSTEIEGWTFLDKDGADTYGIRTIMWPGENDPMAYMVFDVYADEVLQMDYAISAWSGSKVLVSFAAQEVQSNDWIISPSANIKEGDFFSFMARSLDDTWGKEVINVKVRPEGEVEWTTLWQGIEVPEAWTRYEFQLDTAYLGQNVEVAVQHISNQTFALILDDIRIGSELGPVSSGPSFPSPDSNLKTAKRESRTSPILPKPPGKEQLSPSRSAPSLYAGNVGYAIYRDGTEIHRNYGFTSNTFTEDVLDCNEYQYTVKAVYDDVNMESSPAESLLVESCHTVLFAITDSENTPIKGAEITFNNEVKITDSNGEAVFTTVDSGSSQEYSVTAEGYSHFQGNANINADTSIDVTMLLANTTINTNWKNKVSFIPNPVDTKATIKGLPFGTFRVVLYDITGKQVNEKSITGGQPATIDFSSMHPGIYLLLIEADNGETHRVKIIKRKGL